jgi:hypothetical protein
MVGLATQVITENMVMSSFLYYSAACFPFFSFATNAH